MRKGTKKVSDAQLKAIRRSYAMKAKGQDKQQSDKRSEPKSKSDFPSKFPFWARLKIGKKRTTLVIDKDTAYDKQKHRDVDGFVHREATHTKGKDYEEIIPNPDRSDKKPMYLKRPCKTPKHLFELHNKKLDMPDDLRKRYEKNNKK